MTNPSKNIPFIPPHTLSGMPPETPILVALSGGSDSSALLILLADYAKEHGTPLAVAHVDHKLRGADSDGDRLFCQALAARLQLPFYVLEVDVKYLAKENRLGIEEQAREVRYSFFASLMREHNIPLLATAHNADDNAETVIFNLARGSSLTGLLGIPQKREIESGLLIRPLLGASKLQILDFCRDNDISFVTDGTNSDTDYARNRIRHLVIPQLEKVNSAAVANIGRSGRWLRQDEDFLTLTADRFFEEHVADGKVSLEALNALHPAIAARVAARLLTEVSDDVRAVHIEDVLSLAHGAVPHAHLDVGGGAYAVIENGKLMLCTNSEASAPILHYSRPVVEGENPIPEADALILVENLNTSHKSHNSFKNIYKKSTTICINSDRIYDGLFMEPRKEGETILCGGMHKKIKKLMNEKKLATSWRARLPILRDGTGILWVPTVALRDGAEGTGSSLRITLFYND